MASRFSGALQITNLDDFITPSQECIKPIEFNKNISNTGSKIKIHDVSSSTSQVDVKKLEKVEISLADCLACSGCITSAESVLVSQQSQEELLKIFNENKENLRLNKECKLIVLSLSVQPILSIAQRYNLDAKDAMLRVAGYFRQLGTNIIIDMTLADNLSLIESAKEFVNRYKSSSQSNTDKQLPMFSSSCPGWICYAEKTHGNFILPYISNTKSPQQIMGSLVKSYLAKINNTTPDKIYHITLMPCYDKKLEASRKDFYNKLYETRDVDCVITSIEFEQMLDQQEKILNEINPDKIDTPFENVELNHSNQHLFSHVGSGSGGYAHFILNYAAKHLFNINSSELEFKTLKNPDFKQVTLENNGKVLLRFAITNGFKNIQNLVQKLKKNKCIYDYIEIMACPAGCLNGGAQIRPQNGLQSRELANLLENNYKKLPLIDPEENTLVKNIYKCWVGYENSEKASLFLQTNYHQIEKLNIALTMKW